MNAFKVLFVDDEPDFLEILMKRMKKRGVDVVKAGSGEEALEVLDESNPDVVVLDVKMPGMGGIETLREIKKRYPLVEVIMLTGHANVEVAIQGMELGAYDFLMKPCEMKILLEKIESAYERKAEQEERIRKAMAEELATSPLSVLK